MSMKQIDDQTHKQLIELLKSFLKTGYFSLEGEKEIKDILNKLKRL